jgi:hypothetical protein
MFDFKNCILKITLKSPSWHVLRLQIFVLFYVFFVLFYIFFVLFYVFFIVLCIVCFVLSSVFFVCICVLYEFHRVATQLQLNISYRIKIKTNRKGKRVRISKFLLYFSKLHCTSRQPISIVDLAWCVNHVKPVWWSCLKNCFYISLFLGGMKGVLLTAARHPLLPCMHQWFAVCHKIDEGGKDTPNAKTLAHFLIGFAVSRWWVQEILVNKLITWSEVTQ